MGADAIEVVLDRDLVDWLTLAVSAAAALATVLAVWVAVLVASRDTRDRRRLQASMVSAWEAHADPFLANTTIDTVILQNSSTSAIYDVLISWASSWGHGRPDAPEFAPTAWLSMIPPGTWRLEVQGNPGGAMDVRMGVLLEFTDGAKARWMRTARGELRQVENSSWLADARSTNKPGYPLTRIALR